MGQRISSAASVKDAGQTHLALQAEKLHELVTLEQNTQEESTM